MPKSPKPPTPLSRPHRDAVTARLIVRRVKDARYPDALFPVWRYHPFFTDSDEPLAQADITHRRHAIIETDVRRPDRRARWRTCPPAGSAPTPPGCCARRSPTTCCAPPATLAGGRHAVARGATLRRKIVNIPARLARPQRRPILHLPSHWPWANAWLQLWRNIIG